MRGIFLFYLVVMVAGCTPREGENRQAKTDLQGHRGARGLMPENTWPGFKKALDLGVNTLEMDVVITGDDRVVVSHEPWFSHEIALDPNGSPIPASEERSHRIFEMTFEETQRYDCGTKPHPRFPDQVKMNVTKPLLSTVIDSAEAHSKKTRRALPQYNIETKCTPEGDGIFHPDPEKFVDLLVEVIKEKGVEDRVIIQSFDFRTLRVARSKYPDIRLAMLIETEGKPSDHLNELGFTPDIYSPDYHLVNEELISFANEKGMKVIPWTVNDPSEMRRLIEMGVDGIITDYPDRFVIE
jgi:glycerophosphoryl diester phosphodiesterase